MVMVITTRTRVKSRSYHAIAQLQSLTNVPTKYRLFTTYSFQDIDRIRFSNSRSLWQGQRSSQGHTMTLHTYNSHPLSLPSILHLTVSEIQPGQTFLHRGRKCCGIKMSKQNHYIVERHSRSVIQGCGCE